MNTSKMKKPRNHRRRLGALCANSANSRHRAVCAHAVVRSLIHAGIGKSGGMLRSQGLVFAGFKAIETQNGVTRSGTLTIARMSIRRSHVDDEA